MKTTRDWRITKRSPCEYRGFFGEGITKRPCKHNATVFYKGMIYCRQHEKFLKKWKIKGY